MADAYQCVKEGEFGALKTQVEVNKKDISSLKKIYDALSDLSKSSVIMATEIKNLKDNTSNELANMQDSIGIIKADVEAIKKQPAEDYAYYKRLIVGCTLTLVIGYLFGKLF